MFIRRLVKFYQYYTKLYYTYYKCKAKHRNYIDDNSKRRKRSHNRSRDNRERRKYKRFRNNRDFDRRKKRSKKKPRTINSVYYNS